MQANRWGVAKDMGAAHNVIEHEREAGGSDGDTKHESITVEIHINARAHIDMH